MFAPMIVDLRNTGRVQSLLHDELHDGSSPGVRLAPDKVGSSNVWIALLFEPYANRKYPRRAQGAALSLKHARSGGSVINDRKICRYIRDPARSPVR